MYHVITLRLWASHGAQACDFGKLQGFLKAVKSKDVTLLTVEGARHELLKGPERQQVLNSIIAWLTR